MRFRADALLVAILALCLVLVQHGALVHGFVHVRGPTGGAQAAGVQHAFEPHGAAGEHHAHDERDAFDTQHGLDVECDICLAYGALAAAPPLAPSHPVSAAAAAALPALAGSIAPAPCAAYAARAPPVPV